MSQSHSWHRLRMGSSTIVRYFESQKFRVTPRTVKTSKVACFTDDTKVLMPVNNNRKHTFGLQNDIDNIDTWAGKNGLKFNQAKCKCQRITRKKTPFGYPYAINGQTLSIVSESVSHEKDPGVWVSSDLTWNKQVIEQCSKRNKPLGFLRRSSGR
jgi:hypothetical protein